MSRQQRLIPLPLTGAVLALLCLLIGVYLFAEKRPSKPGAATPVTKHPVETPPDEALKYWTEEKKRNAKATNMPHIDAPERKEENPRRSPDTPDPHHS
jgi:hypothetical protein